MVGEGVTMEDIDPKNIVDAIIKSYVNGLNEMVQRETNVETKAQVEKHIKKVAIAWSTLLERLAEQ